MTTSKRTRPMEPNFTLRVWGICSILGGLYGVFLAFTSDDMLSLESAGKLLRSLLCLYFISLMFLFGYGGIFIGINIDPPGRQGVFCQCHFIICFVYIPLLIVIETFWNFSVSSMFALFLAGALIIYAFVFKDTRLKKLGLFFMVIGALTQVCQLK